MTLGSLFSLFLCFSNDAHVLYRTCIIIKELQASYRYLAEIVIYSIGQQRKLLSLATNNL